MPAFRHMSIRRKMTVIIMLISSAALLLACAAFVAYDLITFRQQMRRDLSTLAEIIGNNSTAALTFKDPDAAKQVLSALSAKPHITYACVYSRDGLIFAEYQSGNRRPGLTPTLLSVESRYPKDRLAVFREIVLDGESAGTVYIESDLSELNTRLNSFFGIVLGIMLASSMVALLLSAKLQRIIAEPILHLVRTAKAVSVEKNYSLRAVKSGNDELGKLIDGFNEMLAEIQARDDELQERHEQLEDELARRTALNKELTIAKEKAEEGSRAKSEFLANMSHEIRTPMNAIVGMTELTLDSELTAEQREYLTMVKSASDCLLTLINDILDFSKIEAGKLDLDPIAFNLRDCLGETLKTLAVRAHQKGLVLAFQARPEVRNCLVGDPTRLRQVLVNLVGNAIKFTERGEVVVSVESESEREDELVLRFSVRDTGIGIDPDKQRVIFDAFTQGDGSMTRQYGGTGLGLTISTRLVEMMGGKIWVESEAGSGSTFHFTSKFRPSDGPAPSTVRAEPSLLRNMPVLVVDDNGTNRRILSELTSHWQMKPTLAPGAKQALKLMNEAVQLGNPFPLVLLDCNMPDTDGFILAETIKQDPKLSSTEIMMLTSAGQRGDGARCRQLGVAAYLVKPILESELLEAILKVLGHAPKAPDKPSLVTRHSLRESRRCLRILLAEDNATNQLFAARMLEKAGHTVVLASNGQEALLFLERKNLDVVLMDVQMPVVDGFEATRVIREREKKTGTHIPVIAMTAHAMKGDRELCLANGMDGYVSKPINSQELYRLLDTMFPGTGETPRNPSTPAQNGEVLNKAALLERVEGDTVLLKQIVELFLDQSSGLMSEIRLALEQGDARALERSAHKMKGSVGNFGTGETFSAAREVEMLAREGNLDKAEQALIKLEAHVDQLKPALLSIVNEFATKPS